MEAQIIITDDGSNSIYLPVLDETYHSKYGAINESRHVFITNGLANCKKKSVNIFEVGFGTGLNALLTAIYAEENMQVVYYTSVEKFPLEMEITSTLNFGSLISNSENIFQKIHKAEWGVWNQMSDYFKLQKNKQDLISGECTIPEDVDLIYFDAFAPSKQPELWNESLFKKLFAKLVPGGFLVTYSSAGVVKRALRSAGFIVKRLPGPAGKHHMLVATKST